MPSKPGWTIPLDDGLVMRGAVPEDADALSDYNADVHNTEPTEEYDGPAFWIGEWTRDLVTKPHPRMKLDDIIVVEDSATGKIVSSTVYFDQEWSYCGIPVPVGRPELVSTHIDYRNRGLIRKQFELMHRWGDERGHLVQGITGIPYYYRQFGYEMALEMPSPRSTTVSELPAWKNGETASVKLRRAERADMPLIMQCHEQTKARALFSPDLTRDDFEYQLFGRNERSAVSQKPWIIEDSVGNAIGYTSLKVIFPIELATVYALEFTDRSLFRTCTGPFLKSLKMLLEGLHGEGDKSVRKVQFFLHSGNPANAFLGKDIAATDRPYCWYVRAPDLPKLLMLIAPVLEKRLVGTAFQGLNDEKVIGFYRSGLKLVFKDGRLNSVEPVHMPEREKSMVNMPDLTFLQMLFGRKSFAEVGSMFVDANAASDEARELLDTLFPKHPSEMMFALS